MNDPRTSTTTTSQTVSPPEETPGANDRRCRCSSICPTAYEHGQSPPGLAFRMVLACVIILATALIAAIIADDRQGVFFGLVVIIAAMATASWLGVELALWRVTRVLSILAEMNDKIDRHMMDTEIKLHSIRKLVRDIHDDQVLRQGDGK